MNKFLTKFQRKELLSELRIEGNRRYADRIRVILLLDENKKYKDIAAFLFLDEGTIANYLKRYLDGGIEGLLVDNYARNRVKLTFDEEKILIGDLEFKIFLTTKEVAAHILKKFKVKYSISGTTALLHRLGFSYKKAKGVPGKAKKDLQEKFVEEYNAAKDDGKIYFGDATHPRHNSVLSYGWIKKGKEKEILQNSGRNHINIFGAICLKDQEIVTRTYPTINGFYTCEFLRALRRKNQEGTKITLVLDRGPYNRSWEVRVLAESLKIKIIYLPPYSPNLNPIERLWKFFKKKVLYNKYYEKIIEFETACVNFFRGIRKYRVELKSLITNNFRVVGT